ncbi:MAG TPA: M48 family metalloprotease [Vicinamibacterales bacterium]|nr:M48 family metalloprotease [Vicinamibacterales bacterium]
MRFLLALFAAVVMTACAINPVTGKREISFMSEAQEISVGRELDAQVRQEMGLYEDNELQRYVQELGMQLARRSQRPNLPWSFAVLDSPAVNAFALPGGYIYITRGILPYLDNEAQLVGVLGHEIGHVTARHSAQQYTRGMGASLGVLVGSIFVPQIRPFGDLAQSGIGVLFLKFSRDDELQADALGAEYAAGGGWDPEEVPAFLTTLARIAETTDRNGVPNWLLTHPQPENRATRVSETVEKVRSAADSAQWIVDRDAYLARIDGVVFGDNPEDGVVRGNQFLHPPLRFAIEFPDGWEITNSDEQVVAQEPGNKVFMVLRTIEPRVGRSLDQIAQQHMRESGYKATDLTSSTIGGLQAVVGTYEGNASGIGRVMARGAHVVLGRSTFFIGGIASPDLFPRVSADFDRAIRSFRQLSQAEADAVEPNLVDLYTVREGDTWQSIAQRAGGGLVSANTLAIMNDHAIDEQPKPGIRLKIVVAGS